MRPQGFGQIGSGVEDLGWNDMGFEPPKPAIAPVLDEDHDAFGEELPEPSLRNPLSALTPIASPVHDQQAEIANRFASHDEDGEDEEGDYIDETAELYDGEADFAEVVKAAEVVEADEVVEAGEPAPAPVVVIPTRVAAPAPVKAEAPATARSRRTRAAPGSKAKAAFTLRLDPARHLKLRLACAVSGRSAQQMVTDAVDRLIESMPELESMAERAPRNKRAAG
jgi:hypothetical protein